MIIQVATDALSSPPNLEGKSEEAKRRMIALWDAIEYMADEICGDCPKEIDK